MTHTDPTADAFMRRILANPGDSIPRLVFADWLEETGTSSNLAWSRYLRLSDELAHLPPDDPTRGKLINQVERIGACIRARLTYRAEVFVAYPEAMQRVLPLRCQELNLETVVVPESVYQVMPGSLARENRLFPLAVGSDSITVAAAEPLDRTILDRVQFILSRFVVPIRGPAEQIQAAIDRHHGPAESSTAETLPLFESVPVDPSSDQDSEVSRVWALATPGEADPVVRHVHRLLLNAIRARVSALEFGWQTDRVSVWHHTGGERLELTPLPLRWYLLAVHHIRVMAGLAVASPYPLQTGTTRCLVDGVELTLTVRITGSSHSPRVLIEIPPSPPEPPAALNPAA